MKLNTNHRQIAGDICNILIKNNAVEAVCLLGGLGKRNAVDKFSDIDLAVFVSKREQGIFLPDFSFSIRKNHRFYEINLSQHAFEDESLNAWDDARRSAYRNAKIIYDRTGKLAALIESQAFANGQDLSSLVKRLNQIWWLGVYHPYVALRRGYVLNANLLLNQALQLSCEMITILNGDAGMHLKWFENISRGKDIFADIQAALQYSSLSHSETYRRIKILSRIRRKLLKECSKSYRDFPENPYKYWADNLSGRKIGNNSAVASCLCLFDKNVNVSPFERKEIHGLLSLLACEGISDQKHLLDRLINQEIISSVMKKFASPL